MRQSQHLRMRESAPGCLGRRGKWRRLWLVVHTPAFKQDRFGPFVNGYCSLQSRENVADMSRFAALFNPAVSSEQVEHVLLRKCSTVYASVADIEAAAAAERKRMAAQEGQQLARAEQAARTLLDVRTFLSLVDGSVGLCCCCCTVQGPLHSILGPEHERALLHSMSAGGKCNGSDALAGGAGHSSQGATRRSSAAGSIEEGSKTCTAEGCIVQQGEKLPMLELPPPHQPWRVNTVVRYTLHSFRTI